MTNTERRAIVLAAGGGLGSAAAVRLARAGLEVIACDLNEEAALRTVEAIREAGGTGHPRVVDLADVEQVRNDIQDVVDTHGRISVLVNITGGPRPSEAVGVPLDVWRTQFDAMFLSIVQTTETVLPGMREQKWGRIITSTSSGVITPIPNLMVSNAIRSTVVGWSKTLATAVAADGITANIVVPGRIATARVADLDRAKAERLGLTAEEVAAQSHEAIPAGRYGNAAEFAEVVNFLASDGAGYITGSLMRVDGGLIPSVV